MIKSSDKLVPKTPVKTRDRVKKKRDSGKFWDKNRDCPSKSGTVRGYGIYVHVHIYACVLCMTRTVSVYVTADRDSTPRCMCMLCMTLFAF